MIKSRRMWLAGHLARPGERCVQGFGGERERLGDSGVDGRIIFGWIFIKWDVGHGLDRAGSG